MSLNSSHFSSFLLSAYFDLGPLRYLAFSGLLLLYAITLFSNALLISVICFNRTLHEPMYIFLTALFVNEIFGSTALYPFLLLHILRDGPVLIPRSLCFLQIFSIHWYGLEEYFLLCIIAYDRYIAICHPLQYNTYMKRSKIAAIILVPLFYSKIMNVQMIYQSSSLQLCGNVIHKVYCDNYPVVKLACSSTSDLNIRGIIAVTFNSAIPLLGIVWTYAQILKVCVLRSKETRRKALTTCSPHLASLLNYSVGASFEILQGRFNMSHLPHVFRIFMSLYFLIIPPLSNPFIYGLVLSKIRVLCSSLLLKNTSYVK